MQFMRHRTLQISRLIAQAQDSNTRTYKSAQNIEHYHPEYKTDIAKVKDEIDNLKRNKTKFTGVITNANSKVQARFHIPSATWIPDDLKNRLLHEARTLVNKKDEMIISCDKTRSQTLNKAECLDKIRQIIFMCEANAEDRTPTKDYLEELKKREERQKSRIIQVKRDRSRVKQLRGKASEFD